MLSRIERIRFDFKLREASPGLFEILLHLFADGHFAYETAIARVDGSTAIEILSLAVKYLLDKGHRAHVSELQAESEHRIAA